MLIIFTFIVGICDYGPNCRFSHMSEQDIFYLKRQIEGKNLPINKAVCCLISYTL